jgi:hypothetical protein
VTDPQRTSSPTDLAPENNNEKRGAGPEMVDWAAATVIRVLVGGGGEDECDRGAYALLGLNSNETICDLLIGERLPNAEAALRDGGYPMQDGALRLASDLIVGRQTISAERRTEVCPTASF